MEREIVITGLGAVTPIGIGVNEFWRGLCSGKCGIERMDEHYEGRLPNTYAGIVKDYHPRDYLPMRLVQDMEPYMQYAYISAEEAIRDSGINASGDRIGIVMGSALGGIQIIENTKSAAEAGKAVSPKYSLKAMANVAAAYLSIHHGIRGPSMTVSTACSSGGDAITIAKLFIRSGTADAVIVMAGESCITEALLQSLHRAGALSPTGECRPFDEKRNGFLTGEGGGAIILESKEHALSRHAAVYAKLLGSANNADAYNPVSPEPDGAGAARCMKLALADAGIMPADVDYINAHGTATVVGDAAEASAIRHVFGEKPVVSSTKGATGHMIGAGGLIEVISCVKALNTGILPMNIGMQRQDMSLGLNLVTKDMQNRIIHTVMSNALGFGGQNSSVIIGSEL